MSTDFMSGQDPFQEQFKDLEQRLKLTSEAAKDLEGMLIYRGNRLIRRLERVFGESEEELLGLQTRRKQQHAIISLFKTKSTTTIDKSDFAEKKLIKKVKDWFRDYRQQSDSTAPQSLLTA